MPLRRVLLVGLLFALLPASARAASVRVDDHRLLYSSPGVEYNDLFARTASPTRVLMSDRVPLRAGRGCRAIDARHVTCELPDRQFLFDVHSGRGNDSVTVEGQIFSTRIATGRGNDVVEATTGHAVVSAGPGDDRVTGSAGTDQLSGGPGNDVIAGNAGDDMLSGGPGRDVLLGGDGFDTLDARDGKGDAPDKVGCGAGGDVVDARRRDPARAAGADLFATDCEQLRLGLPGTDVTVPNSPLTPTAFSLSFSCPRRTFRLGCSSAMSLTRRGELLAKGRQRLPNGRETRVSAPLTPAGRALATSGSGFAALVRASYRAGHARRAAAFRLLLPDH